ncbi:VOC family protein [Ruegeria sp. HKCCD7255]|uniref:VOC family protein n=1 Tax=Ruegeria sp. HKCCD7255 TaxID=2683004 RepID=UPI0014876C16|nr:VOC family protein [Ruegeria sp. HKCCD7255]
MTLTAFDHVNVRTANLDDMVDWYGQVLGLYPGKRPDFNFPGAWLYLNDVAVVHLVGVSEDPVAGGNPSLEHFAFKATGLDEFVGKLKKLGIAHTIDPVPGIALVQVNLSDFDGNHIHVDFETEG